MAQPQSIVVAQVKPSIRRSLLLGTTVRIEDKSGAKIGAGYIHSAHGLPGGERLVSIRAIIQGEVYTGALLWDRTRQCILEISSQVLPKLADKVLTYEQDTN